MYRKTRKTLFARVRSDLIGQWTGHHISSSALMLARQRSKPTDSWSPPGGEVVNASGATWGVFIGQEPDGSPVTVWDGIDNTPIGSTDGDVIDGGAGDDRIIASWADDRIMGGDGKDQIDGLAGNDIIEGGDGDDYIRADGAGRAGSLSGTDSASHGADFLDGGAGNDYLEGAGKADQLFGGVGNDQLWGDVTATAMGSSDINAFLWGADYLDGEDGRAEHYQYRSCLRPYLLIKTSIRYPKTAQKASPEPCASRRRAKNRIGNTPNSIAACVSKKTLRLIQVSNLLLLISIGGFVSSDADAQAIVNTTKSTVVQLNCNSHDVHGNVPIQVKSIAGMYRRKVDLPAHTAFPSDGKPTGFNYLAITATGGNVLRVRLTTKEINGHSCDFDSQAVLCGRTIRLLPNDEEKSALESSKQLIPRLQVTTSHISFAPNADGTVISGSPYCGNQGALNHKFSRTTRNLQINNSVFIQ